MRHGESVSNEILADTPEQLDDPELFIDSALTSRGKRQAHALRAPFVRRGAILVVTSPLTRAIQTARRVAPVKARVLVHVGLAERLRTAADIGNELAYLQGKYRRVDFAACRTQPSRWWYHGANMRRAALALALRDEPGAFEEPELDFERRVHAFRWWVQARPERIIVIVSHATFINEFVGHSKEIANGEVIRMDM